jgi:hypothetical protein
MLQYLYPRREEVSKLLENIYFDEDYMNNYFIGGYIDADISDILLDNT